MTAYEAVRAHEVMLNEAVSRLEHASLAPLITLNGGAVVAFLTLLGVLLGKDSGTHPNLWLAGCAVVAWVAGLTSAALAVAAATEHQRAISATHRLLREELEDAVLEDPRVKQVLRGRASTMSEPAGRTLRDRIDSMRHPIVGVRQWWTGVREEDAAEVTTAGPDRRTLGRIGGIYARRLRARWWVSVTMFVAGAGLALAAIVTGTAVPPRHTATTPRAGLAQPANLSARMSRPRA